jgi:hypothetical protein
MSCVAAAAIKNTFRAPARGLLNIVLKLDTYVAMSQLEDAPSSLPELTSLPPESPLQLPPYHHSDTSFLSPSNEDSSAPPAVKINNFVALSSAPDEPAIQSWPEDAAPEAVADAAAASHAESDLEPDDNSSPVHSPALAPASIHSDTAEFEQQRAQLLRQLQDRASAIEAEVEGERERQHCMMVLALEQRKAAAASQLAAEVVDEADKASNHSGACPAHAAVVLDEPEARAASPSASEEDDSRQHAPEAVSSSTADDEDSLRRSRSSSPRTSSRLQRVRPDTRIRIPSPHSHAESARDNALSEHWLLRQRNVDPALHAQLIEMGFDLKVAVVALERTGSASLQDAIDFCLEHNNDDYAGAVRTEGGDSDDSSPDISVSLSGARVRSCLTVCVCVCAARGQKRGRRRWRFGGVQGRQGGSGS